jgi:hypothetical protein
MNEKDKDKSHSPAFDVTKQLNQQPINTSPGSRGLRELINRLDRPVTMMGHKPQKQDNK